MRVRILYAGRTQPADTLALTMGQLLAANKRVLYLNFECCAGLTEMLGKQADNTEFASLLYYLQESKEQFLGRLYQAAECINGMDFILPALMRVRSVRNCQRGMAASAGFIG